jgi:hypothetical protein
MIIVDSLLVGGLRFVLDKIATAVESEMNDERSLKEELLAAQMRLELGEIDDEEFAQIERDVLALLREIREEQMAADGGGGGAMSLEKGNVEVEVEISDDLRSGRSGRER